MKRSTAANVSELLHRTRIANALMLTRSEAKQMENMRNLKTFTQRSAKELTLATSKGAYLPGHTELASTQLVLKRRRIRCITSREDMRGKSPLRSSTWISMDFDDYSMFEPGLSLVIAYVAYCLFTGMQRFRTPNFGPKSVS